MSRVVTGVPSRVAALVRSQPCCLCRQKPTCTPRGPRAWTSYHNDTLVEKSRLLPVDAFSLASPWRSSDATFPPSGHAMFTYSPPIKMPFLLLPVLSSCRSLATLPGLFSPGLSLLVVFCVFACWSSLPLPFYLTLKLSYLPSEGTSAHVVFSNFQRFCTRGCCFLLLEEGWE